MSALTPCMRALPSRPKRLPEAPFPDAITLGVRCQHVNSGDTVYTAALPTCVRTRGPVRGQPWARLEEGAPDAETEAVPADPTCGCTKKTLFSFL